MLKAKGFAVKGDGCNEKYDEKTGSAVHDCDALHQFSGHDCHGTGAARCTQCGTGLDGAADTELQPCATGGIDRG